MDATLFAAFRHLAEAIAPHDRPAAGEIRQLVDRCEGRWRNDGARPSGLLVAYYTALERACRRGDLAQIAVLAERLAAAGADLTGGPDVATSCATGDAHLDALDGALRAGDLWKPFDEAVVLAPPSPETRSVSLEALAMALDRIRSLVPAYHRELRQCVTDILIVRSDCLNAGSSYQAFGIIFLKELQPGQDWSAYFEHIIHESAHHALFAIMAAHRLFAAGQPDERYPSPFRRELRPPDAIFHAAFVLSRLCDALETARLGAFARTPARTARYIHHNPKPIPDQFYDAYEVLTRNVRLTGAGREILASAKAIVDARL
jgi:HEXXH motif-containing protein